MSKIRAAIDDLVTRGAVAPERLGAAFGEIMDGEATPALAAGLLIGLRMKGETVDEIVAVAEALRARATTATLADPRTIDTCGTGGSGLDTFNISTTAAFVVAGAGVPVAKHGNRAATSRSGSFDVLEALGIRIDLPIEVNAEILAKIGIAPFFARTAHPAFRHVAPVRAELGVRTLLNCLGPLLSPVGARYQVVGVYSDALVEPLAEALGRLGAERAAVVHGSDGMDELTTTGASRLAVVEAGRVELRTVEPGALGLAPATLADLAGGTPQENAATTRAILGGAKGPKRDIVLLNAATALLVVGEADSLEGGLERAAASIDDGAAAQKLDALVEATAEAARGDVAVTILDEILAHKAIEVAESRKRRDADALAREAECATEMPRGFRRALRDTPGVSVIAEVKRRSPSKGLIREDFDPAWIATCYAEAGAACISVLTDEKFFGGALSDLETVRATVDCPLIRKDFMIDPYQIDEARIAGADAILLIVSALDDGLMKTLYERARVLGLDVLVEVHDEGELERARALGADLIGVNNRNLKTFEVDLGTTERLAARLAADASDVVLVAESGIGSAEDIERLERAGAAGFLVGESLMRCPHPGDALRALRTPVATAGSGTSERRMS